MVTEPRRRLALGGLTVGMMLAAAAATQAPPPVPLEPRVPSTASAAAGLYDETLFRPETRLCLLLRGH